MAGINDTESSSEEPSIVDAVGFVGSEFDPGVWAVGEAGPFGEVWVNVESGVVVESLGGAVIDPSEIDGRVEIEHMPTMLVGAGAERSVFDRPDMEFDPETGAFMAPGSGGGFEVVGWTEDAAGEVGWVSGVGFYHAGTGEWYDTGLNVVEGGLAEGGRYVSLDEFSDEQREQVFRDAGMTGPLDADEAGELFFDPVTGTLHAYDPEEWVYDGSTWVNLESGDMSDSPTGDKTGSYDRDDLETLRELAEGEEPVEREPAREADGTATEDVPEDEAEPDAPDAGEPPPLEPDETTPESDGAETTETTAEPPTAVEGEPGPIEAHEPEATDVVEDTPTAEVGEPEPLDVYEPEADDGTPPEVPAEAEPEVIVASTETPIADVYESGSEPEGPESLEERTTELYEPDTGGPIGGGSPPVKDEPETMEGVEADAVVAEPKPAAASSEPEPEPASATESSAAQTTKPQPELGEAGGSPPSTTPTRAEPEPDVNVSPPPVYSSPPDPGSLHDEYGPDPSDDDMTAEAPGHDKPGWVPESAPAEPTKVEPDPRVTVSPPEAVAPVPDLDGDHPMEHLLSPERRGTEDPGGTPLPEDSESEMAQESPGAPTVDLHEPESATEAVAAASDGFSAELHEPEPEISEAPADVPDADPDAPDAVDGGVADQPELKEPLEPSRVFTPPPGDDGDDEPEVVVAPTETPMVEVYEPGSDSVAEVQSAGPVGKEPLEPSRVFTPPVAVEDSDEPEVVVAPTETPTAEVYEPEPEPVVSGAGRMREVPVMEPAPDEAEPDPEVIVAPTETPTAELYEPESETTAAGEDWKGFDAGGVKAADDQGFGEWAPVEPSKEAPSESISNPGEVIGTEPQPVETEQPPISWDAAPESEVDDFDVDLVPTEAAGIIKEPIGGGDEDLEPTGIMPPVIQDPIEILPEPVPIETDLVTFEEPLEDLDADLSVTPIHEEPLPLPKDVAELQSSDFDDGDYVDE